MKEGDIRESLNFAFFPTKVTGQWIWLENYIEVYECHYGWGTKTIVNGGLFFDEFYDIPVYGAYWKWIGNKLKQ